MIQRIQSVFLVIAGVFLVFLMVFPIAEIVRDSDQVVFHLSFSGLDARINAEEIDFSIFPLTFLIALCFALTVFTIFLYKKRVLQIRFCVVNIILLLGLQGLEFYYVKAAQSVVDGSIAYKLFFVFPVVAAILVFLALRAIARDEALVRSLDRLR